MSLCEVHDEAELDIALECGFECIGINNRNLKTFETSLQTSIQLKNRISKNILTISESGINTREDCIMLEEAGFDAILVGESLMRQPDPGVAIKKLIQG